jgi:hypothetical protein
MSDIGFLFQRLSGGATKALICVKIEPLRALMEFALFPSFRWPAANG